MSAPVDRVAAVILAAGESRRYGATKLVEPFEGRPLLQHALDAANASTVAEVILSSAMPPTRCSHRSASAARGRS